MKCFLRLIKGTKIYRQRGSINISKMSKDGKWASMNTLYCSDGYASLMSFPFSTMFSSTGTKSERKGT